MVKLVLFAIVSLVILATVVVGCRPAADTRVSVASLQMTSREPFLEPDANHEPILNSIAEAEESLRIELYRLTDNYVVEAVKEAKARGVEVQVILDDIAADLGTGNHPAVMELGASGISVRTGNPDFRGTHANFIVIDDRVALIMGFDAVREGFDEYRGFGIRDTDPEDIAEIVNVFQADWNRTGVNVVRPNLAWGPYSSRHRLVSLIDSAQKTLDMEASAITDGEIVDHLIKAVQRKVQVRVLLSPVTSGPDESAGSKSRLISGGVKLLHVRRPYIRTTMLVVDSEVGFVGSQELKPDSLDTYRALGIAVRETSIVGGLVATFTADWANGR